MKTLITSLFLLGTFTLVNAADKKEHKETFSIDQTGLNQLQNELLENYLNQETTIIEIPNEVNVRIYNQDNQVVYSGKKQDAADLLLASAYLTNYNETETYIILK